MDSQHCISDQHWQQYAAGKADTALLHAIEVHITSCEICADIKEGIDAMTKPSELPNYVALLNKKANEGQKQRIFLWPMATFAKAAAIFMVAVALGWLAYNKLSNHEVVKNKTNPSSIGDSTHQKPDTALKEKATELAIDQKPTLPPQQGQIKYVSPITVTQNESLTEDVQVEKKIPQTENIKALSQNESTDVESASNNDAKKEAETSTDDADNVDENLSKESVTMVEITSKSRHKRLKSGGNLSKKPSSVKSPSVADKDKFKVVTDSDSMVFEKANSNYTSKKYGNAISLLDNITKNQQSKYYEDALLLKSKCFIAIKRNTEARNLLNEVIKLNGKQRQAAENLLKTIKD